jgi:4-amino-4-deoxy-L-arabinose transferase-like glycosyltransferase
VRPIPDKTKDLVLWAGVGVLALTAVLLLLPRLGSLALWMDEGFHWLAARGILDHGYPLFPSGHVYYKAILYTYFLALFSLLFGLSATSLRLVSVLAFAGLLPVAFLTVKRFFGRTAALVAVLGLAFSAWQVEFGRAALYFAPLQVAYLACLYLFYRGYFEEDARARRWALVLFLLIPLIHQLGVGVWFCFPALLFIRGAKRFFRKDVLVPLGVITGFYAAVQLQEFFFWQVGYVYERTDQSLSGLVHYFISGFSLSYFQEFFKSFPVMSLVVAAGFFLCLGVRLRAGDDEKRSGGGMFGVPWLFMNLGLLFPVLFLGFFRTHVQPRYLAQLYPVFLILFVAALFALAAVLFDLVVSPLVSFKTEGLRKAVAGGLAVLLFVLLAEGIGVGRVEKILQRRYGDPIASDIITRSGRFEHYDNEGVGSYVRRFLAPDDIVIAVHVVFGYIYAGRVDYWLWTGGPGTWDAWEKTAGGWKDFYIGAKWVNTLSDLRTIIDENPAKRIWLIASPSLDNPAHVRTEVADYIKSDPGRLVFRGRDGMSGVYLWHDAKGEFAGPPRSLEGEWIPDPPGRLVFAPDASRQCALLLEKKRMKRPAAFEAALAAKLPAGRYELVMRAKTDEAGILERILGVSLQAGKAESEVRSFTVAGSDFEGPDRYREFAWDVILERAEPLVLKFLFTGRANLTLDYIDIRPADAQGEGGTR